MPYKIVKDPKKGYYVMDTSGKKYSKKPLSLARAKRQLAALHIHTGHGLDNIVMPKKDFIKEHHKLLNVLKSQDPKKLKDEYNEQSKELKKVLQGGIAVKLDKYSDGSYGVSDMKGKVLESGLNKQEAEKALTKWYKYQPPTFSSEQSAFKKVKKGGITATQYNKFHEHFISLMTKLRQESVVYPDGTIEISKYAQGPFVDLVKAYFSESEYNLIINSKLFKDLLALESTTNINDFLDLAKRLHPGKFDGAIRSFINDIQTNKKLTQMDQVDEAFKIILIVMERIYSDLILPFIQESNAREYMTEFKAAGKMKGSGVHKRSLLASHNQIARIATLPQRERISAIYFQALAELEQAPKTSSLMDRVRGLPVNAANNARKLNIVQNATARMNQVLSEGLISNPLRAVGAPPRPPGIPPGLQGPLLPSGYFSARQMGPAVRVRAPSSATDSSSSSSEHIASPVGSHRSSMSSESDPGPDDGALGNYVFPLVSAAGKRKKGKGKDDDDKFKLIQQLEIQLINLLRGRQLEKDYDQIDALITNLKSEAESFLVRPGAKLENKEYVRDMLHRVLPSFITALAKIPKQGGGYYQNELQRRMQRFPEHIANPIIQRTLPKLEEIGPSRANLFKGRLFGSTERQQTKQDIIDRAIAQANAISTGRATRTIVKKRNEVLEDLDLEPIETGHQLIDYNDQDYRHERYIPTGTWDELMRRGRPHPYTREPITNPRNVERYAARVIPEEVSYKKYREGTDSWYQPIDDEGNPIGAPSWTRPPVEKGQKYRPRASTIELSKPDIHVVPEPADKPIPVAPIAHPAPSAQPVPIAYPPPPPPPIAHPAPFANIVPTPNPLFRGRTPNPLFKPYTASGKFSEDDMLIGDNILTGGKVRFTDFNIFVQWLNAMFYELLTKPKNDRNNIFKARTEIKLGLPKYDDDNSRTFIVYDREGRYLSLKTHPIGEYDKWLAYYTNKDNIAEWGFPINDADNNALERDNPLGKDGKWRGRKSGVELFFTRIPTSLNYPTLGTPSSSPSGSPKATSSSPKEGPGGFAPGSGPVSLVSASEMAGGPPPPVPGTEGPIARKFREHVMRILGWSEEKVKENPEYQGYLARGEGKVKFVKKYLKGQGLPATKKNVAKVCDIMDSEGVVFEATKK